MYAKRYNSQVQDIVNNKLFVPSDELMSHRCHGEGVLDTQKQNLTCFFFYHGYGTFSHVSVYVYLHVFVHVAVPLLDHVSLPPLLSGQPLKYPQKFNLDHMGSLSGQRLPVNPKSSLIHETMAIWHRSDWGDLPPSLHLHQWTITPCPIPSTSWNGGKLHHDAPSDEATATLNCNDCPVTHWTIIIAV